MDEREQVDDIEVDRTRAVTVRFADGLVARFGLVGLRVLCPCAGCRGLRDRGESPWPRPGVPDELSITGAELVGAYAISFTWNDGHNTGIYPFAALRRWHDEGTEPDGTPGPDGAPVPPGEP